MLRKPFFCFALLLPLALAFAQTGTVVAPQVSFKVVNGFTMPIANARITVCPPNTGGLPCSPALVNAVFKDAALTQPLSNPFTSDSQGNYQFAIAPGNYTVTVTASGYFGNSYQITAANNVNNANALLTLNNNWTGSNTYGSATTFNGATIFNGSLEGITVLGSQGGGGGVGYILFGTGSFTQNTLARFDATGSLVNSFYTDSGAIGAYLGVNGHYSASYNTNGAGTGRIGFAQGALDTSWNGGVNTLEADTNTGMLVVGTHVGSTDITNWIPVAGPYFDALGLSANINPNPTVMQTAAGAATEWRFHVNVNQVSPASCTNAAAGSVVIKLAYTDSAGLETPTIATLAFLTSFTGANSASGDYALRVNSTNNISIQTTYTACTTGTGSYDIHAWLERVK